MLRFILRIIPIVGFSAITIWLCRSNIYFYWPVISGLFLILSIVGLYRSQKRLERSVWLFFRSVKNSDHGFRFNESNSNRLVGKIYHEMNRINDQVNELKFKLVSREQYYQALLDQVSTGLFTLEDSGFINYANPAVMKILNLSIFSHVKQLTVPHPKLYHHLKDHSEKERIIYQTSQAGKRKDLSIITQKTRVREKTFLVVIIQNIREEMEQKELDAWIRLIRVQAHEIKNSLAPIVSVSESLLKKSADTSIHEGIEIILERSKHLKSFVESYHELTHLPPPERSEFNLTDLADRMNILFRSLIEEADTKLDIQVTENKRQIKADYSQLTQVMLNLARNAVQATLDVEEPTIKIILWQDNSKTHIEVADNGHGIPEGLEDEIFIPFFTTRSEGTGIGLSLSRQIIRHHGGEILAENRDSKGACFIITLPL